MKTFRKETSDSSTIKARKRLILNYRAKKHFLILTSAWQCYCDDSKEKLQEIIDFFNGNMNNENHRAQIFDQVEI